MKINKSIKKLIYSIIIDLIGLISYLIPGYGELIDIIWAPISTILIKKIYKSDTFAIINGIEEGLPFTDIIPTATIAWFYERVCKK